MRLKLVLALLLGALPTAAVACRGSSFETSILHLAPPSTVSDVFAAEVEIVEEVSYTPMAPMKARVLAVLQGNYADKEILIAPQVISSCDRFPSRGARGVVVGRAVRTREGALAVDPIRALPDALEGAPASLRSPPITDVELIGPN